FKNKDFIEFCGSKGIKREYTNARTPQQNGVAKRKIRTLIEAARTMLAKNKANKTAGPTEANHSAGTQVNIDAGNFVLPVWSSYTSTFKSSEANNGDEKPNGDTGLKTNEEPKDQEDQAFLEELERLKRQEKEANDAAEAFRKEFAQCIEDLLLQARAARATILEKPSYPNLTNYADQDDSQIPALEDIYGNSNDGIQGCQTREFTRSYDLDPILRSRSCKDKNDPGWDRDLDSLDGIFTNVSYDDEGAVADFTNLESTMNVSPIPTLRIHSIHPTTQILGDPK
ncbi:putative ribonuclease H-like domain-containing protein, partial [Tanacetum coccineum]